MLSLPPDPIAVITVFGLAGFTQGVLGFGSGLVAISLLPMWLDLQLAVPMVALMSVSVAAGLAFRYRADVSAERTSPLLMGALVGVPIGVLALARLDADKMLVGLGVVLVAYVVQGVFGPIHTGPLSRRWGQVFGVIGGAFGGAFGVSGPPALIYVNAQPWEKRQVISTLQVYFLLATVIQIAMLVWVGLMPARVMTWMLVIVPITLFGAWLGSLLCDRLNPKMFNKLMLSGIFLSGCNCIYGHI